MTAPSILGEANRLESGSRTQLHKSLLSLWSSPASPPAHVNYYSSDTVGSISTAHTPGLPVSRNTTSFPAVSTVSQGLPTRFRKEDEETEETFGGDVVRESRAFTEFSDRKNGAGESDENSKGSEDHADDNGHAPRRVGVGAGV
jgi:hypothetical protein